MSSRIAGGCVVVALGLGGATALIAVSKEFGILALWAIGFVALVWSIGRPHKSVPDTANSAPPPEEDPSPEENVQFSIVEDPDNPARHIVVWADKKETNP